MVIEPLNVVILAPIFSLYTVDVAKSCYKRSTEGVNQ